jgi:hypothetical protein
MISAEFVDLKSLVPGAVIEVETKNRHYQIECLGGKEIRISGHPEYCPAPVSGKLEGSSDKTGVLEPGLIGCGKYMRFVLEDQRPVTTSRVLHVHVEQPDKIRPRSSPSIH